jgi:hypothetical protein
MADQSCLTCIFWKAPEERINGGPQAGTCRRFPPTAVPMVQQSPITGQQQLCAENLWVPTAPSDWCGEFIADGSFSSEPAANSARAR